MLKELEPIHRLNAKALAAFSKAEIDAHFGEYAVLVDGRIVSYHKSNREALRQACANYASGEFSVQRIEPKLAN